jgi:secretion/DNA translocation related TadE-like protein
MSRTDEGSATLWTLGLSLLLLATVYVVLLVCVAVGARHRAESAADLSALAGAAAAQLGGDGCAAAEVVAVANEARVSGCVVGADRSITVDVQVDLPPALSRWVSGPARATARAGS